MFWAELHNHNQVGYGSGSLERSYRIAGGILDAYAFTPHGYWPDPPADDPKMTAYHRRAFDEVREAFPAVIEKANAAYRPGEFVTFIAYEWHSTGWGDFVVIFPGESGELYRAQNLPELQAFVREQGALLIPHHVAYRCGWRGLDWTSLAPGISPVVEVFSEHGNGFEADGPWPMLGHSMGGSCRSQCAAEQLRKGLHFGLTAGTDNHTGHPASYGQGITGIQAEAPTRQGVFEALRRRHTLAATGDRIEMSVRCGDGIMGDVLPAGTHRELEIDVAPLAPLDYVAVIKNGVKVAQFPGRPPGPAAGEGQYLIRAEWGWGGLGGGEVTSWRIRLEAVKGRIEGVIPCFAGGAGSTELCNLLCTRPDGSVQIESFTSRANPRPVSGAVLRLAGGNDTVLRADVRTRTGREAGGCEIRTPLADLSADDAWAKVLRRFSSPRIRLGRPYARQALRFRASWRDEDPTGHDTYVVKAQQANGQIAWSSPILFAD